MKKPCKVCGILKGKRSFRKRVRMGRPSWEDVCKSCAYAKAAASKFWLTPKARAKDDKRNRTIDRRFEFARKNAKDRNLEFTFTKEAYAEKVKGGTCVYCGMLIAEKGAGLDRIDNDKGYTPENTVPCCKYCNYARRDTFSPEEMHEIGTAIRNVWLRRALTSQVMVG